MAGGCVVGAEGARFVAFVAVGDGVRRERNVWGRWSVDLKGTGGGRDRTA